MYRPIVTLALVLGTSVLATGCGASAAGAFRSGQVTHVVQRDRAGVVALHGPIVAATADVHVVMTEHCQGRWRRLDTAEATAMLSGGAEAKTETGADPRSSGRMDDDRLIAYECMSPQPPR